MESTDMIEYDVIEEIVSLEEAMDVDLCDPNSECNEEEALLQQKFVQGEIGFTEYSSQLGALYEKAEDPLDCEQDFEEEVTMGLEQVEEWEQVEARETEREEKQKKVKRKPDPQERKSVAEKKVKIPRPRVKLEGALKGMLGEATVMFVKKENQKQAIDMVLEVVRQCPNSPEAYKTLATMYEDIGDMETSIKMLLIGAHLSSDNAEEWVQLGGHFERLGDKRQAITCYSKALKADVTLIDIHDRRLRLCEEIDLKNRGFVLVGYQRFLKNLTPDSNPHTVLELSLRSARMHHSSGQLPEAAAALQAALQHCGSLVRPDHVNLYLELLLEMKRYEDCIGTLMQHAAIHVDYVKLFQSPQTEDDEGARHRTIQVTDFVLPSPLPPPELLAKLGLTLVHLRSESPFRRLLTSLPFDLDTYGDLYLDIAEALIQEKYHEHALEVLKKLVASQRYNQPGVWKHLAETYEKLGLIEECKAAYRKVLEQVPLYIDIRRHLSEIYMKENRVDEAVDVLRQFAVHSDEADEDISSRETSAPTQRESLLSSTINNDEHSTSRSSSKTPKSKSKPTAPIKTEPAASVESTVSRITGLKDELFSSAQLTDESDRISAPLLLDQLMLMMKTGQSLVRQDEFFSLMRLLLSQNCIRVKNMQEMKVVLTRARVPKKVEAIAYMRGHSSRHITLDNRASFTPEPPVNSQDVLTLYKHCFDIAVKNDDFAPMLDIVIQMFSSPVFNIDAIPTALMDQFTLEAALVLYSNGYVDFCYQLFRRILLKYLDSKSVLNIINLIMIRVDDSHIFRNTMRTFRTKPENFGLNVLYANNCILTGNYKCCINEYSIISKNEDHKNPLYLLLLATSYTNIACTKFMDKKALLVSHALAWMTKYKETRGTALSQEILYNTGRMHHQLGLLSQAVHYYKRALAAKPCLPHYDLRSEIAYNLHLVYIYSKSYNLAKHVMDTYLEV